MALTLHGLAASDRQWLLDRLAAPQRDAVRDMLAELKALGIPPDPELIRGALSEASKAAAPNAAAAPSAGVEPEIMAHVLRREGPAMVGLMLAALDAPERQAVLAHCPDLVIDEAQGASPWVGTETLRRALLSSWRAMASQE